MTRELPVAARLGAYAVGLAAAFSLAYGAGALLDPVLADDAPAAHGAQGPGSHSSAPAASVGAPQLQPAPQLPGLSVTQDGYTLVAATDALPAGDAVPYRFTVTGPDGAPVTDYTRSHEKDLHLVVVQRDLTGFQHVHPVLGSDGTWSVPLDLAEPGTYRVFADFSPVDGEGLVLGTDLAVSGSFAPEPLPTPERTARVDGLEVALRGTPAAGRESVLSFVVTRGGAPVEDLQPYLGAYGHLVSLRAGDLAYLHTHPTTDAVRGEDGGPEVRFATTFPTAGKYRLFLDFQVDGQVRTAAFTVDVPATIDSAPAATPGSTPGSEPAPEHGH